MRLKALQFFAIVSTALALVPVGAHFFELPNKIDLSQDAYFTVQSIYSGWSLFGIVLIGAPLADLALAFAVRRQRRPCLLALAAGVLMLVTLAVFFVWTYPTNIATANWTVAPGNWETLRAQWEYSHAANAILTFSALCAVVSSALLTVSGSRPEGRSESTSGKH